MADQNVYDDPVFFANYKKLRENEGSANACVEQPAMFSLCPPAAGLSVLDLGCGSGEACRAFAEMGAARVVGLDLSENMLAEARRQTQAENVSYVQMSMSDLSTLHDTFDLVVSSLAVHYVADFERFAREVYDLLNPGGVFVFRRNTRSRPPRKTAGAGCATGAGASGTGRFRIMPSPVCARPAGSWTVWRNTTGRFLR